MTALSLEEELMGEEFENWLEDQEYERGGVE